MRAGSNDGVNIRMKQLNNLQKQYLRRMAHDRRPAVQIGKNGLTDQVHATIDHELSAHELIKIKFMEFKDEKRELTEQLVEASNGTLIGLIGNIAIVYREQADPEKRQIKLPA
jgi:RNA-binding protein